MFSDDLIVVGVGLLLVAALVLIVWSIRRDRGRRAWVVDATLSLSAIYVAVCAIAIPVTIVQTLTSNETTFSSLPVLTSLGQHLPCQDDGHGGAHLVCFADVAGNATFVGLPTGIKAVVALTGALNLLLAALPAAALGVISFQLLRGAPFARMVVRTLVVCAGAVLVLGLATTILAWVGEGLASDAALPPGPESSIASAGFEIQVPFWPFAAALGLLAVAAVFRYGGRLQRDTEGLV